MAIALELELHRTRPRDTAPSVLDAQHHALTIGLLLTVTLIAFEALAVATVMPGVKSDLGGVRLYGWAFSAFWPSADSNSAAHPQLTAARATSLRT